MQSIKNVFLNIYYKFFDNKNNTYASFSKRFGSFVIDSIIILIIFNLTIFSLKYFSYDINIIKQTAVVKNESKNDTQNKDDTKIFLEEDIDKESFVKMYRLAIAISALYYTITVSSKKQATVGNIIFKIMVIDIKDGKVGKINALLRYISTLINNTLYGFGYIFYFYRNDRAFLQDLLSNTRVVNLVNQKSTSEKK